MAIHNAMALHVRKDNLYFDSKKTIARISPDTILVREFARKMFDMVSVSKQIHKEIFMFFLHSKIRCPAIHITYP